MNTAVVTGPARTAAVAVLSRTLRPAGPLRRAHFEATTSTKVQKKYKTIDDLPGPSQAATAYTLFVKGYADKSHAMQVEFKRLYGPMWRSQFGPYDLVNVAAPELIARVMQQEGRYPVRVNLHHWREYRQLRGFAYGLHVNTGEEWYRIRQVINPILLKPQASGAFTAVIHQVVGDLLGRVELLRQSSEDGGVSNLQEELYKFGFEGISAILFETRLGCLREDVPEETLRFISAVSSMLTLSEIVIFLPRWSRRLLPFWDRFVRAWDEINDIVNALISRKLQDLKEQALCGELVAGGYLTRLLSAEELPQGEMYTSITELLLGGVDTTSNTLCWALYHLSRDPRAQDRLHREVTSVCPGRQEPTRDHLKSMPYLKAVIKETLRLYPVVPGNGRLVMENEVFLDDYRFPKGTQFHLCHYATSHDEAQFEASERFLPERWLRARGDQNQDQDQDQDRDRDPPGFTHHPYSYVPFGVGVRACVGKRVAELEMYFALSRLMQHYKVLPRDEDDVVEAKTRTLMIPGRPVNLRFLPRV